MGNEQMGIHGCQMVDTIENNGKQLVCVGAIALKIQYDFMHNFHTNSK